MYIYIYIYISIYLSIYLSISLSLCIYIYIYNNTILVPGAGWPQYPHFTVCYHYTYGYY